MDKQDKQTAVEIARMAIPVLAVLCLLYILTYTEVSIWIKSFIGIVTYLTFVVLSGKSNGSKDRLYKESIQ